MTGALIGNACNRLERVHGTNALACGLVRNARGELSCECSSSRETCVVQGGHMLDTQGSHESGVARTLENVADTYH
ncbi:hypothetical protein PanWU01x14_052550 [Parasponia andersonii]|uniref:Uncharacterized protein n=1 Tax=Parasponia andersonii TaxID=3476 RepID=A0A2P5DMB4_PARAD|nr:hypothetical protein PanWU01x14_052550 [Parasponia andersonii]